MLGQVEPELLVERTCCRMLAVQLAQTEPGSEAMFDAFDELSTVAWRIVAGWGDDLDAYVSRFAGRGTDRFSVLLGAATTAAHRAATFLGVSDDTFADHAARRVTRRVLQAVRDLDNPPDAQ